MQTCLDSLESVNMWQNHCVIILIIGKYKYLYKNYFINSWKNLSSIFVKHSDSTISSSLWLSCSVARRQSLRDDLAAFNIDILSCTTDCLYEIDDYSEPVFSLKNENNTVDILRI